MKVNKFLTFGLAILVFSCVSAVAQDVNGLLLTVNSSGDAHDADPGDRLCADAAGQCTLRAAIEETNANSTRDAILFSLPQPAVIDLTLGELLINRNLDILGPGARRLTVRRSTAVGTPNFRIFHVPATPAFVNIRGMTIRNGNDLTGGGLYVESGGIVGLFDSAVSGNRATAGGGIAVFGKLTILRSLIEANISDNQGGAIMNATRESDTTIVSSSLTGNSAAIAGAINNEGNLLLINDTIGGNSASQAVSSILSGPSGTINVLNTIIGRDTSQTVQSLQGAFQSAGNNIVTNSTGSTGFTNGVNGDQVSVNNAIDPLLGPLANNGGQTNTMALQSGSPAFGGGNFCVTRGQCPQLPGVTFRSGQFDQRRFRRDPFAQKMDIGAFESHPLTGGSVGFLGIFGVGSNSALTRFAGSPVDVINPATLERRHTMIHLNGSIAVNNLPEFDVYVFEIRAKRRGYPTPIIFALD